MKKLLSIFALALILLLSAGCSKSFDESGTVTVVIGGENTLEYKVDLQDVEIERGLYSILLYLKETKALKLSAEESAFGVYLTQIGDISNNASNGEYIYIYTTVESDFDVLYGEKLTYNDIELTSSGVGIAEMSVKDGAVYYFGIIKC